jgi:O-antigen/teichoic acid export membrane protein
VTLKENGKISGAENFLNQKVENTDSSANIAHRAAGGIFWTYVSFAGSKLLVFISTVMLARLLVPAEFGQVAFALLVISYLETVGDFGVSSALIYEKDNRQEAANAAFLISLATGAVWFALVFLAAPFIAEFFNEPAVVPIVRIMAWTFPINALGNVHDALLRKDLHFRKRLVPDFASALIKGVISIALAWLGYGVWSLVWGQIAGSLISTIALWFVIDWRPTLKSSMHVGRRMMSYGGKIVSVNIISAIVHDADYVVVGRMLGSAALGLYTIAYRIPEMGITMIIWVIGKVTFPVYAKLRDDPPALSAAFLVTLRYLSLLTIPAGVGLAILGEPFIKVLFGEKWLDAVIAMQALAIAGCLRSLGSHAGDVYKATGRPDILVKLGVARAVILVPAMIWAARYGIEGVALAQIAITALSTVANLFIAGKMLSVSVWSLFAEFRAAFAGSLIMGVALYFFKGILSGQANLSPTAALITLILTGAVIYAAGIFVFNREAIAQVWNLAAASLRKSETKAER